MISGILKSAAILALTVISSLAASAGGLFTKGDRIPSGVMRWWGRKFIRIGRWNVRVEGLSNLPAGGAILAANHQSLVDIPLFLAALPRDVRFLAKRELGRIPLFGYAMEKAGNLFIDREDPRDAVHLIREATARIGRGQMVVIFPEGTRSRDGTVGGFKPGAFFLARKTGAPLLPVLVDGGHKALPRGAFLFRPADLVVRVLPPVTADGDRPLTRDEMAYETRKRILSARGQEESPCPGPALV
ncbi:MAG TPA: lysophospholipid acyltransferase family protein [Deferrimonas sp.]